MKSSTIEQLRWWMLLSQRIPLTAAVYRWISRFIMWRTGRQLGAIPGVAAVYSRHTHPGSRTFIAGHSDLDLTVVLENEHADHPACVRECSRVLQELGRRYLFIKPEDARFMSERELHTLSVDFRAAFELPYRPEDWLLIGGSDVRPASLRLPAHLVVMHPEFNKWWVNLIQSQFFRPTIELRNGYMRSLYRSALKNQVHLETGRALPPENPQGFVSDELSNLAFNENPALRKTLAELKRNALWSRHPGQSANEIFFAVLKAAESFYRDFAADPTSQPTSAFVEGRRTEPHAHVFEVVRNRLLQAPEITNVLQSAVAYSFPQAHPYSYRLDLLLKGDISVAKFGRACQALKNQLGPRNFDADGSPVEFTLIPAGIYNKLSFFLGMPYVFLLEQIHESGEVVYGAEPVELPRPASRESLLNWCRMFMAYHAMTFRRRLDYASPVLNFCQLASIQIFIERDRRLTDAREVRQTYMKEAVSGGDENVADYLFRYPYDSGNTAMYDRARSYVGKMYSVLEPRLKDPSLTAMPTLS